MQIGSRVSKVLIDVVSLVVVYALLVVKIAITLIFKVISSISIVIIVQYLSAAISSSSAIEGVLTRTVISLLPSRQTIVIVVITAIIVPGCPLVVSLGVAVVRLILVSMIVSIVGSAIIVKLRL